MVNRNSRIKWVILGGFIFILVSVVLVIGCSSVKPIDTGGEKLAGTSDINTVGEQNFSISPDDNWLFYSSKPGNTIEPSYVLYEIDKRKPHEVLVNERVKELSLARRGPLFNSGCWNQDGTQVFIPGDQILFVVDVQHTPFEMDVIEEVGRQEYLFYSDCPTAERDYESVVKMVQESDSKVSLVDAQSMELTLSSHSKAVTTTRIVMQYPTISPDRNYIAYLITEFRGSFASPSRGYILDIQSGQDVEPTLIAPSVLGPIHWDSGSSAVYASIQDTQGETAIYKWELISEN